MPEFKKVTQLDKSDVDAELVPEAYLDSSIPDAKELEVGIDEMVREAVAFKIKYYHKLEK